MKKTSIIAFLTAAILVAAIITAGCTQDTGSSPLPATNSQQVAPSGGDTTPPADNGGSQNNAPAPATTGQQYTPSGGDTSPPAGNAGSRSGSAGGNHQFGGQNFLTNQTVLTAAAGKLGISEQDLQNALTATVNTTSGRPDLSAAAQQLGISQQQLLDALGTNTGSFPGHGNAMATPGSG